ncbi:MAG: YgfZ/GcvT domain-containing protein [Cellvibrionaceae bacterium]
MSVSSNFTGFVDINDRGFLLIKGPDAKKFLQGQVTCDIDQLTIEQVVSLSVLGAHCTHKGRMLFSFRICALGEDSLLLSICKPLINDSLAALKKYSVFSKVDISDASKQYRHIGYVGTDTENLFIDTSQIDTLEVNQALHHDKGIVIKTANDQYECWLTPEAVEQLTAKTNELGDPQIWTALTIAAGIGEVRPETVEDFIPQMLNFQVVGQAISFNKGCYTGQEVVARMEYLGKLKRHMYRLSCSADSNVVPGMPLYSPTSRQSIGNVVICQIIDDSYEFLAVTTQEAIEADAVYIDEDCQKKVQVLTLPYAITKE